MKLTDYVIDFIAKQGIDTVFGLTGGAVVHLFDSVDKNSHVQPVFCHHEQAAALAAVTYSRVKNGFGAAIVTTGPGGTNAITGVASAWQDSIPCIFISGQARKEHTSHGKSLRQLGTQELDIVSIVKPITKYAVMVEEPKRIRYHLEKAVHLAKAGRPGPVWIDIPLDFQWTSIDPDGLPGFDVSEIEQYMPSSGSVTDWCKQCYNLLDKAERPLILAGYGIRLAHAERIFKDFLEIMQIPFVSSYTACDIVSTDCSLYIGRPGISGQRGANLAVQNCDLLICIGSHLSIPLTGTLFDAFARGAKIIMVDIDNDELEYETVHIDCKIRCDGKKFLEEMVIQAPENHDQVFRSWRETTLKYKTYNVIPHEWRDQKDYVNPYVFVDVLSHELTNNDVTVVDGGGTVFTTTFQAVNVKEGQRVVSSTGIASMGSGLPESIGACLAKGGGRTVCLCGDGSMQLNIQELQTIIHHNLPIKIFVFNNDGYLAIRHTQNGFLEGNYVGSDESGGVSLPNFRKVAKAYGIKVSRISNHKKLERKIQSIISEDGPVLCEIMISREQEVIPRQGFYLRSDGAFVPRPLEDMYPYLDRKEFLENMMVEPLTESMH
ncbi:thiamine pyrophosphate-binding protein [Methanospirillum sp.]